MTKRQFAIAISKQVLFMAETLSPDRWPVFGMVERSTEEQQRLFAKGLSDKDGIHKRSAHQLGIAADVWICREGSDKIVDPKDIPEWSVIRNYWRSLGGAQEIPWDRCHFEG